jgi:hypothetical protein
MATAPLRLQHTAGLCQVTALGVCRITCFPEHPSVRAQHRIETSICYHTASVRGAGCISLRSLKYIISQLHNVPMHCQQVYVRSPATADVRSLATEDDAQTLTDLAIEVRPATCPSCISKRAKCVYDTAGLMLYTLSSAVALCRITVRCTFRCNQQVANAHRTLQEFRCTWSPRDMCHSSDHAS